MKNEQQTDATDIIAWIQIIIAFPILECFNNTVQYIFFIGGVMFLNKWNSKVNCISALRLFQNFVMNTLVLYGE